MEITVFIMFLGLLSFLFAKVEIAIEGPQGWAQNLPTWKLQPEHWVSRLFFGGRPATGYHVWMILFIVCSLHIIYVFNPISLNTELKLLSFLALFAITEDFLWFVLNPAFGIRKFKKENIWWHANNWFIFAPREYFIFIPIGIILYIMSSRLVG